MLTSFSSLDIAQQKVLLSSKLLTEEQKIQCATMMALSSANTKYTAEQLIRATGISSETLATWGLTQATDTLTVSQLAELASSDAQAKTVLEKIVAQNAQAVANGKVTATNIALATSEEGATLATGAFTTAIKANIAAIKTWLLTTPAGWLTILVGGIFTAVKLYDLFTISVEEANEKIDESDLSVSKELENNKTSKMLCMKNVLKSNYTDSKLMNINEANKFERKLNQMNINENSINRKNVLVNSKNLLNGLNSNLEYAKNAKENDSDEIQIKYVKNLVKNLDTYNNKEVLSKVEQEIMYINNLKQKQKYLEKLKNKLIKLEKKENSTSIFSKLFRR